MKKTFLLALFAAICCSVSASESGAVPKSKAHYPEFTWDRVPVCLHFSKMSEKRGGSADFTEEEAAQIAKHPIICIEKTQGGNHGSLKEGTIVAAKAIKAFNPKVKVLYYQNSGKDFFGVIKNEHPEWHLMNQSDVAAKKKFDGTMGTYDHSNPKCREWWANHILDACDNEWIDGAFIDGLVPQFSNQAGRAKAYGTVKAEAMRKGLLGSLTKIKNELNSKGKMIIGNTLRGTSSLPEQGLFLHGYLDGGMIEHFDFRANVTPETLEKDMMLIKESAKRGKICVVKAWPRLNFTQGGEIKKMNQEQIEQMLKEDITYPLACFLAVAGEYSYFCYSWGYREHAGGLVDFPEYNYPLGRPLGDAKKKGWVYTREFEHASIRVDIGKEKAEINWKEKK